MIEELGPSAKVLLDSVSDRGDRLTTMEVTMHRFVLAEWNTHRVMARNSASSRAIPVAKMLARVNDTPALPVEWGVNQPGMQADEVLGLEATVEAAAIWLEARDAAVLHATRLGNLGVHKQVTNRLLEPFMWHVVIASATEWQNFFAQRATIHSPLAQPEMRAAADAVLAAFEASTPSLMLDGEWHTPLIQPDEDFALGDRLRISAARSARVSYLTHEGTRDPAEDLALFDRLVSAKPMHASPFEHVATPADGPSPGNFDGWRQLRHIVESGEELP